MDIFEQAARLKLRFDTSVGQIAAEDLFDLPLTSRVGKANLDDVARAIHRQLKNDGDHISFVDTECVSDPTIQLRLDIVKHVIEVKKAERAAADKTRENAATKQKIMALIAERKDEDLKGKPLEDLEAMLANL